MSVHKFSRIVRVVPSILHPHGEVVLVEAFLNKLAVSSYSRCVRPMNAQKGSELGRDILPKGGFTSVTLVLCPAIPVRNETREGQHWAIVT